MTKMISTGNGKTIVEENTETDHRAQPDSRDSSDATTRVGPTERLLAVAVKPERHVSVDSGVEVDLDASHDNGNGKETETEELRDAGLLFPKYTCGVYDDLMVLKLSVKHVEESGVKSYVTTSKDGAGFSLRFSTQGSGEVPNHYGFDLVYIFDGEQTFSFNLDNLDVEIWDNGIIVKANLPTAGCSYYKVGNCSGNMREYFLPQLKVFKQKTKTIVEKGGPPRITETSDQVPSRVACPAKPLAASAPSLSCGILKVDQESPKKVSGNSPIQRENFSDPCTNIKKCVRFNEVVKRQIFRTNSSILGRRIKNLKKSEQKKRRGLDRRASESDVRSNEASSPEAPLRSSVEDTTLHSALKLRSNDDPDEAESTEKSTVAPESIGASAPDLIRVDNNTTNVDYIFALDI